MKKLCIIPILIAFSLATQALAGTLTVSGSLTASTNLTAQSITLGGVTRTNWPDSSASGVVDLTTAVLDFSQAGSFYRFTLTANTSWVFTNHVAGRDILLQITEDATGGWTNTWPANLLWPGGQLMNGSLTSNSLSVFRILDNGTYWLAHAEGLDFQMPCTNCNYALRFDGRQNYVTVPYDSSFYPSNFTVEAWIKTTTTSSSIEVLGNEGVDGGHGGYSLMIQDGYPVFESAYVAGMYPGSKTINDGAWHHIAVVFDGSANTVYVDGTADASASSGAPIDAGLDFTIGAEPSGQGDLFFPGTIDEVRVSDYARYTTDFTPATKLSPDGHTIALWKFTEGGGPITHDSSGNGHDGTLYGSPLWVPGF